MYALYGCSTKANNVLSLQSVNNNNTKNMLDQIKFNSCYCEIN